MMPVKASGIKRIITTAIKKYTSEEVERIIDSIKSLGFYGSTVSGISVSVFDNQMVPEKDEFIEEAEEKGHRSTGGLSGRPHHNRRKKEAFKRYLA